MESSDFLDRIPLFIRQNLLVILLVSSGILLLGYGVLSMLFPSKNSNDIVFEQADDTAVKEIVTKQATIVVDVSGAVQSPGVYKLTQGQRIQDALGAAGGLSEQADRVWVAKSLNLAAKLTDGMKLYVPFVGESVKAATASGDSLININTASSMELDSLPGVGSQTVGKIMNARPFTNTEELLEKKIVSKSVFEKIKDMIVAQ
jgi:competence protein ComEA